MSGRLHVVGSGIAGLACAVAAAKAGAHVTLYEAARHAGGRCRSYVDPFLDRVIDNGSHLLLGVNRTALEFCSAIGGVVEAVPALFPFLDPTSGRRWILRPGRLPAGPFETLAALGLPWCGAEDTVATRLGPARSYSRLWKPLTEAILNTAPEDASAKLLARVLRSALLAGRNGLRPHLFPQGLSAAFAAPALATLAAHGGSVHFGARLKAVSTERLTFEGHEVETADDQIVLALPPWALPDILPEVWQPPTRSIVNAHYRLDSAPGWDHPFLGVWGRHVQWVFVRGDVVSVTVSAAEPLAQIPADIIASMLWSEIAPLFGDIPMPLARVVKERRATLAHTPEAERRRPGPATPWPNVWLAGDWLASPWPCTIEAAAASGLAAARLAMGRRDLSFA